jgi:hypothetical protein
MLRDFLSFAVRLRVVSPPVTCEMEKKKQQRSEKIPTGKRSYRDCTTGKKEENDTRISLPTGGTMIALGRSHWEVATPFQRRGRGDGLEFGAYT